MNLVDIINALRTLDYNDIVYFLTSPNVQQELLWIKLGFLLVAVLMGGFTIFAISKTHYMQWRYTQPTVEFLTQRPYGAKRITKVWKKIKQHLADGSETEYKLAIIEADNMLEATLKRMGYGGVTLEERLAKLTSATLPNIDNIYQAHQTRNSIVHDPNFVLTLDEAQRIINVYEQAFRDLQILD